MKLKTTALALCLASTTLAAAQRPASVCKEPVSFYPGCDFEGKGMEVTLEGGHKFANIAGKPKAVSVPAGCLVTLFSTVSHKFSSASPSHGMFLKGPIKSCVADHGMVPVAMEIKHDADAAAMASDIDALRADDASLKGANAVLQKEVHSLESVVQSLQQEIKSGALRGATGATGSDGIAGKPGAPGAEGKVGPRGEQGPPGKDGRDGAKGVPGPKGTDGTGLHLKAFKVGVTYNKGDYVFHTSSKGGHHSMFIAETKFIAKEAPANEKSGFWTEFEAPRGEPGQEGKVGPAGPKGDSVRGPKGDAGKDGAPGKDGMSIKGHDGKDGAPGKDGKDGAPGPIGPTGPRGPKGETPTSPPIQRHDPVTKLFNYGCINQKKTLKFDYPVNMAYELHGAGGRDGGDRSHGPNYGGVGARVHGALRVEAGKSIDVYIGCTGSWRHGRIGGGGGGSSAILVDGKAVVIAGAGGGGAGVRAAGGHSGQVGQSGGDDRCRGGRGGGGASQTHPGYGGGGNRGKPNGRYGGDDGSGGNAGHLNGVPGGWGYKRGGHSSNNPGDGGGGGGGAGYKGGGGGGTGCHGSAGGGGSSWVAPGTTGVVYGQAGNRNGNGSAKITFTDAQ